MKESRLEKSVEVKDALSVIAKFDLSTSNHRYGKSTGKSAASLGFRFIDYLCWDDYDLVGNSRLESLEQRCWDDLDEWIANTNTEGFNWEKPDFLRDRDYEITWTDEYELGIEAPIYDVLEYRDNLCKEFYDISPNTNNVEELEDIYAEQQKMNERREEIIDTIIGVDKTIISFGKMLLDFREWVDELKTHWKNHNKEFITIVKRGEWDEESQAYNEEFDIVEPYAFDDYLKDEGWQIYDREFEKEIEKAAGEMDKEAIFHLCKRLERRVKKDGVWAAVNTLTDWRYRQDDNWEFANERGKYYAA